MYNVCYHFRSPYLVDLHVQMGEHVGSVQLEKYCVGAVSDLRLHGIQLGHLITDINRVTVHCTCTQSLDSFNLVAEIHRIF